MTADIIDAHHHLWDLTVRDQPWITGPDLAPLRRDFLPADFEQASRPAGVVGSVVVQTVVGPQETPELLAIARDSGVIGGVVGWVDLTAADLADDIRLLQSLPGGDLLVGIRHQVQSEPDPDWLVRPDVVKGLTTLADAELVYDLVVTANQLTAAIRAAAAVPELTFVLDHLGKPPIAAGALEPWAGAVRELAALPNTACKLSGMVTEADWQHWTADDLRPFADTVLEAFGPGRLMFGSDWPVCTLAAGYRTVVDTSARLIGELSISEQRQVFSATARRVYGLSTNSDTAKGA